MFGTRMLRRRFFPLFPRKSGRRYLTLDDPAQLAAARSDPEAFVRSESPLTVDEAQKCPELLTAIKREVDRARRPGRFLLSGSANFALLKGITESLAGRALYLTLHPFTRRELAGKLAVTPFIRRAFDAGQPPRRAAAGGVASRAIVEGGLPPVCLGEVSSPALWFKGYEQTYLERDVRELARIGDLVPFRTLLPSRRTLPRFLTPIGRKRGSAIGMFRAVTRSTS